MWEVFYTPHTDDECIGMAGAIWRAHMVGHQTCVVLVTDNEPSARGTRLFPIEDLKEQRKIEWRRSMRRLEVTELQEWNIAEARVPIVPFAVQEQIYDLMVEMETMRSVVHHHTVWGLDDIHLDAGFGSLSHGLCANAATRMARNFCRARVSLHGIYIYSYPKERRYAPIIDRLSLAEQFAKREALHWYKETTQTIGYGFKSVPELILNAAADPNEYILDVSCSPTPP